ncbi:MAG: cobalamin B12-binding domain-containing protein [Deltaproteobacteria bacterium]|nr:cobalamin B12-binding domain-containing protein [Deltaproteobacteria bacterium]
MPGIASRKNRIRIVTAASLFDGHDAAINVIRRLLVSHGAEVVHLGHNRGAAEVADAAIQEDAQAVALSSYQGGHMEYFRYVRSLLDEAGAGHLRIFGGGGGVIVPREIATLEAEGITKIFSPEDGRRLGLEGMIEQVLEGCDFNQLDHATFESDRLASLSPKDAPLIASLLTAAEAPDLDGRPKAKMALFDVVFPRADRRTRRAPVLGITGPGGAGKSSLTDELALRYQRDFPDHTIAILAVDPTKKTTGGALLGDRIRMNSLERGRTFFRSLATRQAKSELSHAIKDAIRICQAAGFDLVIVETAGIGQGDAEIAQIADVALYAMTAEFGAQTQLEKIEMIDHAHAIAINKFERRGSEDALRDVRKQYRRSHKLFGSTPGDEHLPIFGTIASQFADPGVNRLYVELLRRLSETAGTKLETRLDATSLSGHGKPGIIPPNKERYLSDIAEACRTHREETRKKAETARKAYACFKVLRELGVAVRPGRAIEGEVPSGARAVADVYSLQLETLGAEACAMISGWEDRRQAYAKDELVYEVRGKKIKTPLVAETLSGTRVPKVLLPKLEDWGEILSFSRLENVPGEFPFTAGVFPLKRTEETPTRMFAGEGPPERTNHRFHLLAKDQPTARLSTAFDSVTLYGEDPAERPDIYGKIGESGVSVATVEDAEKLYAGFDLSSPKTSVSMTINGPAPIVLAFFMNAAIRQRLRRYLVHQGKLALSDAEVLRPDLERGTTFEAIRALATRETYEEIKAATLRDVRGTVQADILKEDQAQNTCIFSTEFALKMMGDVQEYFVKHGVKNYYSASISGYHIAEAGANPITQLAFTLANGFTYVAYYTARGMKVDDFGPNLSFFFSNGLDPEYAVIGRVARRIWSVAMKRLWGADERSQKLKYHIQTSGRSLHAREMAFNDIRTTLQALYAMQDNTNSLHTNAFDEALTTPTPESVRRAIAIQMVIDKELGWSRNENPLQGSYFAEWLTEVVEAKVLEEFDRISSRGGVLGAMETQYQRGKIQDESLEYERRKHDGSLPIIGVNTFLDASVDYEKEANAVLLSRSTTEEKDRCISNLRDFWRRHETTRADALASLCESALSGQNVFAELMETVNHASLGQISGALYGCGGRYRRNG